MLFQLFSELYVVGYFIQLFPGVDWNSHPIKACSEGLRQVGRDNTIPHEVLLVGQCAAYCTFLGLE